MIDENRKTTNSNHLNHSNHSVSIVNRDTTEITGVIEVVSFDENTAILETTAGVILLRGENIHMSSLDLTLGEVGIDGYITSLSYTETQISQPKNWIFGKLLK